MGLREVGILETLGLLVQERLASRCRALPFSLVLLQSILLLLVEGASGGRVGLQLLPLFLTIILASISGHHLLEVLLIGKLNRLTVLGEVLLVRVSVRSHCGLAPLHDWLCPLNVDSRRASNASDLSGAE